MNNTTDKGQWMVLCSQRGSCCTALCKLSVTSPTNTHAKVCGGSAELLGNYAAVTGQQWVVGALGMTNCARMWVQMVYVRRIEQKHPAFRIYRISTLLNRLHLPLICQTTPGYLIYHGTVQWGLKGPFCDKNRLSTVYFHDSVPVRKLSGLFSSHIRVTL